MVPGDVAHTWQALALQEALGLSPNTLVPKGTGEIQANESKEKRRGWLFP